MVAVIDTLVAKVKAFYRTEWGREPNRKANLNLLKAAAFFAGAVVVSSQFGETFAV